VFVVRHGANDPSLRAAPQVAQSVYYALPKLAKELAGDSEISYRFFSVLAMAGALLCIANLAGRLLHPDARWLAVFACLALHGFNYQADDARPYALGTLVLSAALMLLVRWLDSGRLVAGLAFALVAALLWWVHLIFWPSYLVLAIYVCFRLRSRDTKAGIRDVFVVAAVIVAGLIPLVVRAESLLHDAAAHVVTAQPLFRELLGALKLTTITGACTAAVLISRHYRWNVPKGSPSLSSLVLILGWWLVPPLSLFAFSHLTGDSVFVDRYLSLGLPGVALTACLSVSLVIPFERWKPAALALGLGILVFSGQWGRLFPTHQNSRWREAASGLRQWIHGEEVPVICPSPFVEARTPVWKPGVPATGFLYSNLLVYPPGGKTYSFPFQPSQVAENYAQKLLPDLLPTGRFAIFGGDENVRFWREWFAARPELADAWQSREIGSYGDVAVVVFKRGDAKQN